MMRRDVCRACRAKRATIGRRRVAAAVFLFLRVMMVLLHVFSWHSLRHEASLTERKWYIFLSVWLVWDVIPTHVLLNLSPGLSSQLHVFGLVLVVLPGERAT